MLKSKWARGVVIGAAGLMIPLLAAAKTNTLVRHRTVAKVQTTSAVAKHTSATKAKHLVKLHRSVQKLHTHRVAHRTLSTSHVKHHALSTSHVKHHALRASQVKHHTLTTRSIVKPK